MRCLLDVMMAVDEMMRLLMFHVPFHPPFPFALPPLPGSSRFACLCLFPRPRVVGGAGGCRFAAAGGWRSACLSSPPCRSLAHRSFAVSRSIAIGFCLPSFHLLSLHRMSNELVKTALADRSSIKPFQFIPIHSPLPYWLPHDVFRLLPVLCVMCRPHLACLPLTHPLRSSA